MHNIHPLFVHFPIALLLAALIIDLAAVIFKHPAWHQAAFWNLVLATAAAALAVWSGLQAEGTAAHPEQAHEIIELHEKLGIAVLFLAAFATLCRITWRNHFTGIKKVLVLALMVLSAATVSFGAYLGGRLVYEFGVGGDFGHVHQGAAEEPPHHHHHE